MKKWLEEILAGDFEPSTTHFEKFMDFVISHPAPHADIREIDGHQLMGMSALGGVLVTHFCG